MDLTRRETLLRFLFGAGGIGLRALATGLPVSFLMNPRRALAQAAGQPQYVVFNTTGGGDPIGTNCPGTYEDPNIYHSPGITQTSLTLNGNAYQTGHPWATPSSGGFLPQSVLDRTQFWHIMTNTPVHAKETDVLKLMGASPAHEMLPSLLAQAQSQTLGTLQAQPVALGAQPVSFNGQALPLIPPSTLKDILGNPAGPLTQLQSVRDNTMQALYAFYKQGASPAQKTFMDQMSTSQMQIRSISQNLIGQLQSIKDDGQDSQMTAAVALIQMNLAPVFVVSIDFGGDNHSDPGLQNEAAKNISGVQTIAGLMSQLATANLSDKVSFMSLNVFGRTLATQGTANSNAQDGRNHNPNLQTSVVIGKPFPGQVIGGVAPADVDYGCTGLSVTGASGTDIAQVDTLAAFAKTMLQAVGADPMTINGLVGGQVVTGALGP